jgi:hypothetical protein
LDNRLLRDATGIFLKEILTKRLGLKSHSQCIMRLLPQGCESIC